MPRILCRPKHHDHVRMPNFIALGLLDDVHRAVGNERRARRASERQHPREPMASMTLLVGKTAHYWWRISSSSLLGIAPSRSTRHPWPSSERSTMVEATSRGEVPPSMMMEMRSL